MARDTVKTLTTKLEIRDHASRALSKFKDQIQSLAPTLKKLEKPIKADVKASFDDQKIFKMFDKNTMVLNSKIKPPSFEKFKKVVKDIEGEEVEVNADLKFTPMEDVIGDFKSGKMLTQVMTGLDRKIADFNKTAIGSSKGGQMLTRVLSGISKNAGMAIPLIGGLVASLKLFGQAMSFLKNQIPAAINRFDSLEKYPRVLEQMGVGYDAATRSQRRLVEGIDGLETKLDDIIGTTQRLTQITGSADTGSRLAVGMNNMLLASGADANAASRALEQWMQMMQSGVVDMQSWRSVQEVAGTSLNQLSQEMLGAGKNAMDLYQALQKGEVSIDDVNRSVIQLSDTFGDMALANARGIQTSLNNFKTGVQRGLADTIKTIDSTLQEEFGKGIADYIDGFKDTVVNILDTFTQLVGFVTSFSAKADKIADNLFGYFQRPREHMFDYTAIDKASEAIENVTKKTKEYNSTLQDSADLRSEISDRQLISQEDSEIKAGNYKNLIQELNDLRSSGDNSSVTLESIKSVIGEINKLAPGLGLEIDGDGALNRNSQQLEEYYRIIKQVDEVNALKLDVEDITPQIKENNASIESMTKELDVLADQREKLAQSYREKDGFFEMPERNKIKSQIEEIDQLMQGLAGNIQEARREQKYLAEMGIDTANKAMASGEGLENLLNNFDDLNRGVVATVDDYWEALTDTQKEALDNLKDLIGSHRDYLTDFTNYYERDEELTIDVMLNIANQKAQLSQAAAELLDTFRNAGVSEAMLDDLAERGADAWDEIFAMGDAWLSGDTQKVFDIGVKYDQNAQFAVDDALKSLGLDENDIPAFARNYVFNMHTSIREQIMTADFSNLGTQVAQLLNDGMLNVKTTMRQLGIESAQEFETGLQETLSSIQADYQVTNNNLSSGDGTTYQNSGRASGGRSSTPFSINMNGRQSKGFIENILGYGGGFSRRGAGAINYYGGGAGGF